MSEAALRDRIEYLEAENANLRQLLRQEPLDQFIASARRVFRVAPSPCRLLWQLMDGRVKSREALFQALFSDRANPPDIKIVDVQLCHVRRGLRAHDIAIINVHSVGYQISADDCAEIRALLGIEAKP